MAELAGSKTLENLKAAFANESQVNRRYLYFAKVADVEGEPEVAELFRATGEGETGHAHGHLELLRKLGDPLTGMPISNIQEMLKAAIAGETQDYTEMYPRFAEVARDEGFEEMADWFDTLTKAEKSHSEKFRAVLSKLS